ncbi:MAG: hypothetical protein ACKO5P_11085, partial [Nodosilinea sp.]
MVGLRLFPWGLMVAALGLLPWTCGSGILAQVGGTPVVPRGPKVTANWRDLERDILVEQNRVRQNPASYIPLLEARLASMDSQGYITNGC